MGKDDRQRFHSEKTQKNKMTWKKNIKISNNDSIVEDNFAAVGVSKTKNLSALQMKFAKKLQGSKFRMCTK